MDLSTLSDFDLDESGVRAAQNERLALHIVLEHLAEVQRRKSFSPRYKSIREYAMLKLGYDDKSAWRRVNAIIGEPTLIFTMPRVCGGVFEDASNWMHENMQEFGFFLPYSQDLNGIASCYVPDFIISVVEVIL